MDDTEDDAGYPTISYGGGNDPNASGSTQQPKNDVIDSHYPRVAESRYGNADLVGDENNEDEENSMEVEEDENVENNGSVGMVKDGEIDIDSDKYDDDDDDDEDDNVNVSVNVNVDDDDDGENDDDDGENDDDDVDDDGDSVGFDNGHYEDSNQIGDEEEDIKENNNFERHPKKRKLKNLISRYEFAPRIAAAAVPLSSAVPPLPKLGRRNSMTDWTGQETFSLLDAWGDKFVQLGRKSLRSEEWQDVAEKVSEYSNLNRTDTQCRNRLDTLKKKYKKEKMKLGDSTKWVYFKKMDALMSSSPMRQGGLSCGLDSGEYVFMNPEVYLNCANGLDEMMDSPGESEFSVDSDGPPPRKARFKEESSSYSLLADSIQKFSETYEKIESSKRQQMVELEKMRMDFHRDLELQKREILEKAQAEIAKLHGGDEEVEEDGNEISGENMSG